MGSMSHNSKAQVVRELLLSGETFTRKELAEKAGVSATTIPRCVNMLREQGYTVEAVALGGNERAYRLIPEEPRSLPPKGSLHRFMGTAEYDGAEFLIFASEADSEPWLIPL